MKVIHLTKTFYPETLGGIEEVVRQLALASQKNGIKSEVVTLAKSTSENLLFVEGIKVHRFPISFTFHSSPFSIKLFKKFSEIIAKADILHCHFPWPLLDLLFITHKITKPVIVTYHCDAISARSKLFELIYRPFCKKFLHKANTIIATSPNIIASSKMLQKFKAKVQCIPLCLDIESYPAVSYEASLIWQKKYGDNIVLFIGALRHYKGLEFLINAARKIKGHVVIAGDGPLRQKLEQLIFTKNILNVHLLGRVSPDDKMALLEACKVVVLPSILRSEAFGVALLEGAMTSKPLVSTNLGTGTSYVNINGETGWVISPGDVEELAEKINDLLVNEEKAKQFGARARKRFEGEFGAKKIISNYIELYQSLI